MSANWVAKLVAAACAIFAVSAAPSAAARLTIDSAGLKRTAVIVDRAPLKLARRPLVIVLHGENGNGARIRRRLGLYPDGIRGHWPEVSGAEAKNDVAMLQDLTTTLVRRGLVNPRLIFIVGESTGGAMAIRAVCSGLDLPIAGLATINSSMPADLAATCATTRPLAYLDINGRTQTGSASTALAGASTEANVSPAAAAVFAKSDGCSAKPLPAPSVVADPHNRDVAYIESFSGCKAPVEQVRILADGQATSVEVAAASDRDSSRAGKINADAARLVWAFLKKLGA